MYPPGHPPIRSDSSHAAAPGRREDLSAVLDVLGPGDDVLWAPESDETSGGSAPAGDFDAIVIPRVVRDPGALRGWASARRPNGALVFLAAVQPDDPAGDALLASCRAQWSDDGILLLPGHSAGDPPEWIVVVSRSTDRRWSGLVRIAGDVRASAAHAHEIARLAGDLADRERDAARAHDALDTVSMHLRAVLDSRSQRLASIFRDAYHDWRMALVLPFRLAGMMIPDRLRSALRPRLLPVLAAIRGRPVRRIRNAAWPASQPLVSVVIPCFNYGRYAEEAVASVLGQTLQDFEIIVVDGGSDDGETPDILARLSEPRLRLLTRTERHLVGDNRNHGIEQARGKYVCCLDADDVLAPTYLEKAVFVAETGGYDLITPSVQCFGASSERWFLDDPSLATCATDNGVATVAVFRRTVWSEVGGYRDFGLGADYLYEDWDFWLRILANAARARSLLEPLMLYRVHDKGLTATATHPIAEHARRIRTVNREQLTPEAHRRTHRALSTPVVVDDPTVNLGRLPAPPGRHVLFALPFTIIGGADTILLQIARALVDAGATVSVVTTLVPPDSCGSNSHRFEEITPHVYHLPGFLRDEQEKESFVDTLISSTGVDTLFLVGSTWFYEQLPRLKRRHKGLRVVDQLFNDAGHLSSNRKYEKQIDLDVVASEPLRDAVMAATGRSAKRVVPVIHGVDTEGELSPENVRIPDVFRRFPQLADRFLVTFVGRLSAEKAPETFLQIAERLAEREDFAFVMIGDGPEAARVEERVRTAGMSSRLLRPGFVDDVRPFLAASSVLVIPSRIEGIPIVMLECLSLGVPVVASAVGGIPTVIRDGEVGFLADPEDPASFSDRIAWMADEPSERAAMGRRARELARRDYSIRRMTDEYLRIFEL